MPQFQSMYWVTW